MAKAIEIYQICESIIVADIIGCLCQMNVQSLPSLLYFFQHTAQCNILDNAQKYFQFPNWLYFVTNFFSKAKQMQELQHGNLIKIESIY